MEQEIKKFPLLEMPPNSKSSRDEENGWTTRKFSDGEVQVWLDSVGAENGMVLQHPHAKGKWWIGAYDYDPDAGEDNEDGESFFIEAGPFPTKEAAMAAYKVIKS
jgi:hypothetical protein